MTVIIEMVMMSMLMLTFWSWWWRWRWRWRRHCKKTYPKQANTKREKNNNLARNGNRSTPRCFAHWGARTSATAGSRNNPSWSSPCTTVSATLAWWCRTGTPSCPSGKLDENENVTSWHKERDSNGAGRYEIPTETNNMAGIKQQANWCKTSLQVT